ncbi:ankyrin repeat domain-containing protein 40 isoform X1 [Malaclemys terrapin pileata]|uniref:ankyrin repeat domain-containing protein 40 isoform X1 n=1 Tax=Malaclemys terrapin pileata TaxID=2991368 RepID=UPI0023A7C01A|nr:ankyrin repeat domain-containing protein 40 isoform X1 [Malaclemys terrapin pileata]
MTTSIEEKELQERLREAAALGDIGEVQRLVEFGVNVNSQNEINGWTCLHWACKRNHAQVVSYLIESGADKEILTSKGETPAQLTSKREIRKTLGVEEDELADLKQDSDLPIVPNYLANPPFPYVYNTLSNSIPDPSTGSLNGSFPVSLELQAVDYPISLPRVKACTSATSQHENVASAVADNEDMLTSPGACTMPECPKPVVQNGPIHQASVPQSRSFPSPAASKQPVSQQQNGSCLGPMPTFQPFFFPGTFPFNMQELVLKVRIQNLSLRENDFIEIELDRQELTYKELLRVSCSELGVNPEHVEKIRKLPNTVLRKDKDVARLQDFQELELVLIINDNNFLFRNAASTLTERPCYNKKASKLTY